jgi:hypothetical protein
LKELRLNSDKEYRGSDSQTNKQGYFLTTIESVRTATPSVRLIDLKVVPATSQHIEGLPNHQCEDPSSFTFKPGQWIDTYVPHLAKPGGFSFVSTPQTFFHTGTTSLAIQKTENPPSKWLWGENTLGKHIMIRVGGNFTFPPTNPALILEEINYVQFIAGGVGIKS